MAHLSAKALVQESITPQFLSRVEIHFEGFSAPAMRLIKAGWDVSSEYDVYRMGFRLAFRPKSARQGTGLILVTQLIEDHFVRGFPNDSAWGAMIPIRVEGIMADNSRIEVQRHVSPAAWVSPGDVIPPPEINFHRFEASEFYGFSAPVTTPAGIIVSADNVGEVLDLIRKVQVPEQEKIRESIRRSERSSAVKMEAQIFTLHAA